MDQAFQFKTHQKIYLVIKRCLDVFFSTLLILILIIPMLVLALITTLTSKGPAFFRQNRLGKDEKPFRMMKFRSMKADAPQIATSEISYEEEMSYVTKWGRFMRVTSLDELPQLFCIFTGTMSFVGPRPCQDEEHEGKLVRARREQNPSAFAVKPGLTGLAQVKMHRDHNPITKAQYDSEYIRKLSFFEDCYVFFKTFTVIFHSGKQ